MRYIDRYDFMFIFSIIEIKLATWLTLPNQKPCPEQLDSQDNKEDDMKECQFPLWSTMQLDIQSIWWKETVVIHFPVTAKITCLKFPVPLMCPISK